jgi:hypothetical protein
MPKFAIFDIIGDYKFGCDFFGTAHFFSRRFDEAVPMLLLAIQEDPSFCESYRVLAACHTQMGQIDEACAILARLKVMTPYVMPTGLPYRNANHRELYLSGLRLAAGEEK